MTTTPEGKPAGSTPLRAVRIDDDLWEAAKNVAEERHETVSEVIRAALRDYVIKHEVHMTEQFMKTMQELHPTNGE